MPADVSRGAILEGVSAFGFNVAEHERSTYAENRWLRRLLEAVAQDLERIACLERYAKHVAPLRERAQRIRRYLHEGFRG
jgi:hypothetical protein